jgi:hypothetical protein
VDRSWEYNVQIAQRHMNVEIGAEAALFPEKEYINGIAVAVHPTLHHSLPVSHTPLLNPHPSLASPPPLAPLTLFLSSIPPPPPIP